MLKVAIAQLPSFKLAKSNVKKQEQLRKRVRLSDDVQVEDVAALLDGEVEDGNFNDLYYSPEERKTFRQNADQTGKEIAEKSPAMVTGIECIFRWSDLEANDDAEDESLKKETKSFLRKWASMSADHRGLEKRVITKEFKRDRLNAVAESRTIVFQMQTMLDRAETKNDADEIIRESYKEATRPSKILAKALGKTDKKAVDKYIGIDLLHANESSTSLSSISRTSTKSKKTKGLLRASASNGSLASLLSRVSSHSKNSKGMLRASESCGSLSSLSRTSSHSKKKKESQKEIKSPNKIAALPKERVKTSRSVAAPAC
ncbi:hypothetical protein SEMRO_859_G212050.1 [Seminavis robusta]|uniref:Uncharacterized protein n=1 Tax=Seminavis robusta TaxID=568900 RepID=A0A9N8HLX2_9STRA|nr:hypothetical protein SEMRO_859_G212050.1 [Seminavis robusta]|eukprot:Sro859_g212050.1 n/a (316) ;mRNA; f:38621-39568